MVTSTRRCSPFKKGRIENKEDEAASPPTTDVITSPTVALAAEGDGEGSSSSSSASALPRKRQLDEGKDDANQNNEEEAATNNKTLSSSLINDKEENHINDDIRSDSTRVTDGTVQPPPQKKAALSNNSSSSISISVISSSAASPSSPHQQTSSGSAGTGGPETIDLISPPPLPTDKSRVGNKQADNNDDNDDDVIMMDVHNDDKDDDVEVVEGMKNNSENNSENNENNNKEGENDDDVDDDDDDDDDDLKVISSTAINPNVVYAHGRPDCGVYSFKGKDKEDQLKHCPKCYCVTCDTPVMECTDWEEHCVREVERSTVEDDNDEILLESPSITQRNSSQHAHSSFDPRNLLEQDTTHNRFLDSSVDYSRRRRRLRNRREEDEERNRLERERNEQRSKNRESAKLRIVEVLAKNLTQKLKLKEEKGLSQLRFSDGPRSGGPPEEVIKKMMDYEQKLKQQRYKQDGDIEQLGLHSSFFVEGVKIGWPFPAIMLPQRQMAIHIIKALKRKLHVVLESPTGTGKSAAILCSVLAWQRHHVQTSSSNNAISEDHENSKDNGRPRIIYCSRTHSQVAQMVSSLKKTPYRPIMTVLGSRERMCIHKELTGKNKKGNKIPMNIACQSRKSNTEKQRKSSLTKSEHVDYDDDSPPPNGSWTGDGIGETSDPGVVDGDEDPGNGGRPPRKPRPTCPHYRQLTSERTADMVVNQFIGGGFNIRRGNNPGSKTKPDPSLKCNSGKSTGGGGCGCGNNGVGGEESAFGVHDMEDLVRFGKNPYREDNITIYRGKNDGLFGFTVRDNNKKTDKNNAYANKKGCHVGSIKDDSAATYEGRLQVGDQLLQVNGKDVRMWKKEQIFNELNAMKSKNAPARLSVLRANADTDPEDEIFGKSLTAGHDNNANANDEDAPEEPYSEHTVCPYYLSRAIQPLAELTFAPYNYILDPGIRKAMNISLENTVVVLDEAHNIESTLCESGSGKYGELDLCQLVCSLAVYLRPNARTGNITLISSQIDVDTGKVAHDLLLFVEKIIFHLQKEKIKFENSRIREKMERDYKQYHNIQDDHEVELTYDGPTGWGIKGEAVGCKPFLELLGITKEECGRLLELAMSMEEQMFGGNSENPDEDFSGTNERSNVLTVLIELLSKLATAAKNPEHFYISCVAQANGNLDHAFGIEEHNNNRARRWKKKPRMVPFIGPCTPKTQNAHIPFCSHDECRPKEFDQLGRGVKHGYYCNGSLPPWECHLVLKLLSPGLLLRDISGKCRSVILASGSLAPLPSLCAELDLFGKDSPSQSSTSFSQPSHSNGKHSGGTLSQTLSQQSSSSTSSISAIMAEIDNEQFHNRLQTKPKPLEANHVVNLQKQLLAVGIGNFPNGEKLTIKYENYKDPAFFPKFGHAVAAVIESIPRGGCLIFFPSYSFLNKCVNCWNPVGNAYYSRFNNDNVAPDVWSRLLRSKGKVIVEPTKSQEEFEAAREEYTNTIKETGSCILLAVFRGKMSEGISFNDGNARAVICVGMPYPNAKDRSVKAKQQYNDEQRKLRKKTCLLPGMDYYAQQAHRAIAQALGRCIRHGADYGTVILMDSRHCDDGSPNNGICWAHKNLPKWMRSSVQTLVMRPTNHSIKQAIVGGYAGLRREMKTFFAQAPIASQAVLDKWKMDLKKVRDEEETKKQSQLEEGGNGCGLRQPIFNSQTGEWILGPSSVTSSTSNNSNVVKTEKKSVAVAAAKGSIDI